MRRFRSIVPRAIPALPVLIALAIVAAAAPLAAQSTQARRVADAVEVFTAIVSVPEREMTNILLREAWGVAIIPNVRRSGFIVGVQSGDGVMVMRGENGSWGSPLFISLSGGVWAGRSASSLRTWFSSSARGRAWRPSWTAASPWGWTPACPRARWAGQAGAGTDADMRAEIYSYSRPGGSSSGSA